VAVQAIPAAGAGSSDSLREEGPCLAKAGRCASDRWRCPWPLMPAEEPEPRSWRAMSNKLLAKSKAGAAASGIAKGYTPRANQAPTEPPRAFRTDFQATLVIISRKICQNDAKKFSVVNLPAILNQVFSAVFFRLQTVRRAATPIHIHARHIVIAYLDYPVDILNYHKLHMIW
jgi:hypothetical protein